MQVGDLPETDGDFLVTQSYIIPHQWATGVCDDVPNSLGCTGPSWPVKGRQHLQETELQNRQFQIPILPAQNQKNVRNKQER